MAGLVKLGQCGVGAGVGGLDGLDEAGSAVGDVVGVAEDVLAHHVVGGADVDPVPHLPVGQLVGLRHPDAVDVVDELEPVRQALQPGGRLGEPEEMAEMVAFLLSDEASYVNAVVLSGDMGSSSF